MGGTGRKQPVRQLEDRQEIRTEEEPEHRETDRVVNMRMRLVPMVERAAAIHDGVHLLDGELLEGVLASVSLRQRQFFRVKLHARRGRDQCTLGPRGIIVSQRSCAIMETNSTRLSLCAESSSRRNF